MEFLYLIIIGVLEACISTTNAEIRWTEKTAHNLGPVSNDIVRRVTRSSNSKCGTDYIFDYLNVVDGINRTNLAILMRKMNIGNDKKNGQVGCSKV